MFFDVLNFMFWIRYKGGYKNSFAKWKLGEAGNKQREAGKATLLEIIIRYLDIK
jgi:hypothetical protein